MGGAGDCELGDIISQVSPDNLLDLESSIASWPGPVAHGMRASWLARLQGLELSGALENFEERPDAHVAEAPLLTRSHRHCLATGGLEQLLNEPPEGLCCALDG